MPGGRADPPDQDGTPFGRAIGRRRRPFATPARRTTTSRENRRTMLQTKTSPEKRSRLQGAALTQETLDSSPSVLRPTRSGTVTGLQQYYSPPEVAQLLAGVHGTTSTTLDLTAGDGALLAPLERACRFGIEIDADQVQAGDYTALTGDVQRIYPMLRLLRAQVPRLACNPPFGLDWTAPDGRRENSTVATWRMAQALLASRGLGAFVAGRDRFLADVLSRSDAAGVYALVECPDLFDGVELPTVIAFFAHPGSVQNPREGGPVRLFSRRNELTTLTGAIVGERDRVCGWLSPARRICPHAAELARAFTAVQRELDRRRKTSSRQQQTYDLALVGGRISVTPSPFARLALAESRALRIVERLRNQPATYFALNLREWKQIQALASDDVLTIAPELRDAVTAATHMAERDVCPLYAVVPQMRLGFLDDLDSIRCVVADPTRGFVADERYPLVTRSDVKQTTTERPVQLRNGDIEIRKYEQEAKILQIRIGDQLFDESAEDVAYLQEHFELPDPGDLATRFPDQVQSARDTLTALADEHGFEFFRDGDEQWQLEDLARLVVKGSGVLAWEQGGGKSLGGATLIHAAWEHGARRRALIVCPQDLIPQWTREIAKFYGITPTQISSPAQARRVARDLRSGGQGLYITHYEALSLVGRVDEPLPETRLRFPSGEQDEYEVPTSKEYCPACHASYFDGWQQDSRYVCASCGYVHKRLKVKTAGHYLAHAFADGTIIVDEGTLAKGNDSLRSKAIRGLRARHRYLLTGTPVSNYIHDVFWLLWWTLGNATLRFPYSYDGGRGKFENDFCVIEYLRRDGRREARKVLPQVTNVSRLWRLLAGGMVRRRKQHMGKLVPRTTRTIAAPMGSAQLELYRYWLDSRNFQRFFAYKHPGHKLIQAGLVEKFAAALGQLTKLEYATTLPEADPDRDWDGTVGLLHSNWTPKNLKVLQVAMEHVQAGEKVLIGSDLIETGRWLAARLQEKGVRATHIVEERAGKAATMSPRKRAQAIEAFKHGSTQVLCCGIPSIRLGHSLETASCVIATGLVFSYEMFDQFIARAWRLTSTRPVSVYVALTLGSLDPRKWDLLRQKAQAADLTLDGQLVDEPEQPISREQFLRDLRRQGVRPTGDEIAEADIQAAWHATPVLSLPAGVASPRPTASSRAQPWRENPIPTPGEQLDLFG